jgi:hypothetical protein
MCSYAVGCSAESGSMQKGHCKLGNQLYETFRQKSLDMTAADTQRQRSVSTASRAEWRALAQRAEEAKQEFERVRCAYVEHVMTCRECEWDRLAEAYLNAIDN